MIIYIISQVRDFTSSNSWLSRAAMCKCSHFTLHSPTFRIPGLCLFFYPAQKLPFQSQCWSSWSVGSPLPPASQLSGLLFMQSSRTSVYNWCQSAREHLVPAIKQHQLDAPAREHVVYHLAILLVFTTCEGFLLGALSANASYNLNNRLSWQNRFGLHA